MSLTTGRGPLSANPAGRFSSPVPEGVVYIEPFQRRVRGVRDGDTIIDSEGVLLVHRPGHPPAYAFPASDVHDVTSTPDVDAPGYVAVAWDAVDTTDTVGVYETSLAPKLYAAPSSVRTELLRRSDTTTYCPYKGTATWWSAVIGDTTVADVAWSYEDPYPECVRIRSLLSFEPQRITLQAELPAAF